MRELRTKCCLTHDTFWDDLHVCRKCNAPNPEMIEVEHVDWTIIDTSSDYDRTTSIMDELAEALNPTRPRNYGNDGTAPCDKCGVAVRERDFCGDGHEFLCPDCYDTDETPTNQQGG